MSENKRVLYTTILFLFIASLDITCNFTFICNVLVCDVYYKCAIIIYSRQNKLYTFYDNEIIYFTKNTTGLELVQSSVWPIMLMVSKHAHFLRNYRQLLTSMGNLLNVENCYHYTEN